MICAWWNDREDGARGAAPVVVEHHTGTPDEVVRMAFGVYLPWYERRRVQVVVRSYSETARVTVSLERLRVE